MSSDTTFLDRAHQQAAVAALGQEALLGVDFQTLLEHAAIFVAQTLSVDFTAVFQRLEDNSLRCVSGHGWPSDAIRKLHLSIRPGTMAKYVLEATDPVIVEDLRNVSSFEVPAFARACEIVSAISVVISHGDEPWGILEAYSIRPRVFDEDDLHFLQAVANAISTAQARRQAEAESTKLAAFAQHNPNPVLELNAQGELVYFNEATRQMSALLRKEHPKELLPENVADIVDDCLTSGASFLDLQLGIAGRTIAWSFFPITSICRVHAYAVDVTERLNLEAQLRQAQKMEAIGQLAAGVAHDFNNILTIFQGLVERLKHRVNPEGIETLQQLSDTAHRAGGLTRQLLAFSRRQVLQPRVIDLREVVSGVTRMLQRLIGEDIVLTVHNAKDLPPTEADPSMMEQVLLNLAVNARDAMPRGGQLMIVTETAEVPDQTGCVKEMVCLRVCDTGSGMNDEVKARIFEPFFTTKEIGKGTGLGLATVFGIVKQHGGTIEVETELGEGTMFSIFLPISEKPLENTTELSAVPAVKSASRGETILLVEDEPLLRELAEMVLAGAGYQVLGAGDGGEAFDLWREHRDRIDLLLTDMVLPGGINGRELAVELQRSKPSLKIIYTTGYSSDALETEMHPVNFLQKPYPPDTLTRAVRACLDAG